MVDTEKVAAFRREAAETHLISLTGLPLTTPRFTFDLSLGSIVLLTPTAQRTMELVRLAYQYRHAPRYGEHNALLDTVTARSRLGEHAVVWVQRFYFSYPPEESISLRDWLRENGQNPDEFNSEMRAST